MMMMMMMMMMMPRPLPAKMTFFAISTPRPVEIGKRVRRVGGSGSDGLWFTATDLISLLQGYWKRLIFVGLVILEFIRREREGGREREFCCEVASLDLMRALVLLVLLVAIMAVMVVMMDDHHRRT